MNAARWAAFGGVRHAPGPEPGTVRYLPEAPSPQMAPDGRPAVSLLVAGESAFLQLGTQWDPPADVLERLRAHLAEQLGGPVALTPPPLTVRQAVLLRDGAELQAVPTSGYPPWVALFALTLAGDARSAAAAALHGEPGRLAVRFDAELDGQPLERQADVADWLAGSPSEHHTQVVGTESIADLGRVSPPAQPPRSAPC